MDGTIILIIGLLQVNSALCLKFTEEPQSATVEHHAEVTLQCRTDSDDVTIRWLFQGQYVDQSPATNVIVDGGTLTITSFKFKPKDGSHIGVYQCEASNEEGTVLSREAVLEKAVIHNFDDNHRNLHINVTEGNVALIPCNPPRGRPDSKTIFRIKDNVIDKSTGRYLLLPSGNLQIGSVRRSDQGAYRCIAFNPVTGQERGAPYLIHLKVIAPISNSMTRFTHTEKQRVEVITGKNLTLECVAEGSPVPLVSWNKYGGQLPENRFKMFLGNLVIYEVQRHDTGTYICSADNGIGSTRTTVVHVDILQPPVFEREPQNQIGHVGGTVTLECAATGYPAVRTSWLHNGEVVSQNDHIAITDTSVTLTNLQSSHSGIYQCAAHNKLGKAYSHGRLQVLKTGDTMPDFMPSPHDVQDIAPDTVLRAPRPTITSRPVNMSVMTGDTIVIPCSVPDPIVSMVTLTWSRGGKPLRGRDDGGGGHGHRVAPSGALQLFNVRPTDAGTYVCTVSNEAGIVTMRAILSVEDNSRRSTPGPEKGKVRLEDGESIDDGILSGVSSTRGRDRSGRARGKGKRGREAEAEKEDDADGDVSANGDKVVPPSRPDIRKLSDTSVMLQWEVPQNDGLPIMFFKVQFKQINAAGRRRGWRTIDEDIRSDQFMYEVSGLQVGGIYKFRVLAVYSNNDNKQGRTSRKFEMSVPEMPNVCLPTVGPTLVRVRPRSPTEINIEWQYMQEENCPIEGFVVSYRRYNSGENWVSQPLIGGGHRQFSVKPLEPKTHYSFKVQTFNSAGYSEDSNKVVQETLGFDEPGIKSHTGPIGDPDLVDMPRISSTTVKSDNFGYVDGNTLSTQKSSEMLYMVLGIVLGVMMLLLLVFMAMCAWKQRQQRRMMNAEINAMRKFDDPSKSIYYDSLHKKQNGVSNGSAFLLGNLQPNGAQNGHVDNMMNGGTRLHITPNPMDESERQHGGQHNLQDMLPPPPPTMPPAFPAETAYHNGTLDGRGRGRLTPQPGFATLDPTGRYTPQHSDSEQTNQVIDPAMYTVGSRYSDHQYNDAGIYYSLNRGRSPDQLSLRSNQLDKQRSNSILDHQMALRENPYAQRNPQFDRLTLPRRKGSPIVPVPPVVPPPMRPPVLPPGRELYNMRGHESDSSESSSEELIERLNSTGLTSDYHHLDRNAINPLVRPMRDDSDSEDETSELYPPPSPIDNAMYPSTSPTPPPYLPPTGLPSIGKDSCSRGRHASPRNTPYQPSDAYHTDCHIYQDIPAANEYPPSDS